MKKVTETDLPGVGVRYDMVTDAGRAVGVVAHQTGRRDLVVYDAQDRDRARESVELSEDEGHRLGQLLGGSREIEHIAEAMHGLEDLRISWVRIDAASAVAGMRIAETSFRRRTGAGIVAIVSDSGSVPVPGGTTVLVAGDTAVVVGTPDAVDAASALLSRADRTE